MTTKQSTGDTARLCVTVAHNVSRAPASSLRDARAIKSSRALEAALLALLERKPLEQITIREIAAGANVNYATFFRHHPTREALLDHVAADQIGQLVDLTVPILDRADGYASVVALCRYVRDHRVLWTTLLTGGAAGAMRQELLRVSRHVARERGAVDRSLPVELAVNCAVGLIIETLTWWLAQPPDSIEIETVATMLDGLLASLERV